MLMAKVRKYMSSYKMMYTMSVALRLYVSSSTVKLYTCIVYFVQNVQTAFLFHLFEHMLFIHRHHTETVYGAHVFVDFHVLNNYIHVYYICTYML